MATTKRTVDEAKTYLSETIDKWSNDESKKHKIIALAGFAERWNNTGGGTAAKIKSMTKDIKAYDLLIKRGEERGDPTETLLGLRGMVEVELKELQTIHNTVSKNLKSIKKVQ